MWGTQYLDAASRSRSRPQLLRIPPLRVCGMGSVLRERAGLEDTVGMAWWRDVTAVSLSEAGEERYYGWRMALYGDGVYYGYMYWGITECQRPQVPF